MLTRHLTPLLITAAVLAAAVLPTASQHRAASDPKMDPPPANSLQPQLEACRISSGAQKLSPIRVAAPAVWGWEAGDLHIEIDGETVSARESLTRQPRWKATVAAGLEVRWWGYDGGTAYLETRRKPEEGAKEHPEAPRLRRLDLVTGRWQEDLPISAARKQEQIAEVLPANGRVAVLTVSVKENPPFSDEVTAYRVTCFRAGEEQSLWSRAFPSAGGRSSPGVFLLAPTRPDYADDAIQSLSWMGDELIVCAGPQDEILCLAADTGKPRWRRERIWEFQRGFIGPSVWAHYLSRFGTDRYRDEEEAIKKQRTEFNRLYECAIVGGPVVVPLHFRDAEDPAPRYSLFVAVSRGPASADFPGYVSDCILYEINEDGEPIAILNAPRMLEGARFAQVPNGLAWAGQDVSLARLAASENRSSQGFSPGSPNLLLRVDWFRQFSTEEPEAWLVADPLNTSMTFSETHAFCSPAGGYVRTADEHVYRFPLSVMDLGTGLSQNLILEVPFRGQMKLPTTNYRQNEYGQGKTRTHTWGPYELGVAGVQPRGRVLEITLEMEDWTARLEFDRDAVLQAAGLRSVGH